MTKLEKKIFKNVNLMAKTKVKSIDEGMLLKENLGLASLDLVSLITNLSKALNISILEFSDADLINLKSVKDLVNLFKNKLPQ